MSEKQYLVSNITDSPKVGGFTLIEILMVVAITGILAVFISVFNINLRVRKDLDLAVGSVAAVIRDAQQKSITQELQVSWGIYLEFKNNYYTYALEQNSSNVFNAKYLLSSALSFDKTGWIKGGTLIDPCPVVSPTWCYQRITFTVLDGLPVLPINITDVIITISANNNVASPQTIKIAKNGTVSY